MKKFLDVILNPKNILTLCSILFIVAIIDVNIMGATTFSEMSLLGNISVGGIGIIFAVAFVRYMFIPIVSWIGELLKK